MISDFEEGTGSLVRQGTPVRTGWWYTYYPGSPAALPAGTAQMPARSDNPIAVAADPGVAAPCNRALHSTGSGFGTAPNNYAGFGAAFLQSTLPPPSQVKGVYDLSLYTGISFKIKSGTATPPPAVYFEILTKDSQPATSGGTAAATTIDLFNTRGQMLNAPWTTPITNTYQTITVPFGTLIPRWVPAVGASMACPIAAAGVPRCQAPRFNAANVLGIQFSMYQDPGFPRPAGSTAGTYDLWVDDVALVKADMGLPPGGPVDGAVGSCVKPVGPSVGGKFLVQAYTNWKNTFVIPAGAGFRVQRPENGNDTVSEGIAYGMLIAVYMNDKPLFDGLWTYWKTLQATADGPLMTWNNSGGAGSATDADEDAAFALLEASKKFTGGTYAADALNMMHAILAHDMSGTFIMGGSNYSTTLPTNPSYFAPAYYTEFAKTDTANAGAWNGLATGAYSLLAAIGPTSANGLYAAWCTNNCTTISMNTAATDVLYQYDSHRIPFRIGLDYCWHGTAAATTYLNKVIGFFANNTNAGLNGVGRIADLYSPGTGLPATGAAPNSASIIGTAAVGAMSSAAYKTFLDDAYQGIFDMATRGTLAPVDTAGKTPYSYYNATVGMLTLLAMTGNLRPL